MPRLTPLLMLCLLASQLSTGYSDEKKPADAKKIRILLCGDSTVAEYSHAPDALSPMTGWGQVIGEHFTENVEILNRAAGGRSSKSFLRENRLQKGLEEKPDYVLIQFGHNDCPGKGDRTTDPATDFRDYLRVYITKSREAGAVPALITPVARRTYSDGKLVDILRPYAEAMIVVGREEQVPVIDLHQSSTQLYQQLGEAGGARITFSDTDRTHFSKEGAEIIATLIVDRIPEFIPTLKPHLQR